MGPAIPATRAASGMPLFCIAAIPNTGKRATTSKGLCTPASCQFAASERTIQRSTSLPGVACSNAEAHPCRATFTRCLYFLACWHVPCFRPRPISFRNVQSNVSAPMWSWQWACAYGYESLDWRARSAGLNGISLRQKKRADRAESASAANDSTPGVLSRPLRPGPSAADQIDSQCVVSTTN